MLLGAGRKEGACLEKRGLGDFPGDGAFEGTWDEVGARSVSTELLDFAATLWTESRRTGLWLPLAEVSRQAL